MFKNPFSFNGRIRRLEYGLSLLIIYAIFILLIVYAKYYAPFILATIIPLIILPMYWFIFAQGAKRCHDRGDSGWWQIVPFYGFLMLFSIGEIEANKYGDNPKGLK